MNRYANSEISLHVGGCGFDRQRGLVGFGGRAVHPDHIPIVASPFRDFADFGTAARQRRGSNRKLRLALIGTGWRDLSRRAGLRDSSLEESGFEPSGYKVPQFCCARGLSAECRARIIDRSGHLLGK